MTDKVTILVEIGGKKYKTERKVTHIYSKYNASTLLYREAIRGVDSIFSDIDNLHFEEWKKEEESETSN